MTRANRLGLFALLVVAAAGWGCSEASSTSETTINATPPEVLEPSAPGDAKSTPAPAAAEKSAPEPNTSSAEAADASKPAKPDSTEKPEPPKSGPTESSEPPKPEPADPQQAASACFVPAAAEPVSEIEIETEAAASDEVTLEAVKYEEMMKRIAANTKAKLTIVDAWAMWCAPCKENFPHVVQMNAKYASQGLAVISLSLDDPTDAKAVADAKKFLQAQKAAFTNFVLNEEQDAAFEKLNVNGIPAVFLYGPGGKEIKRFTLDDPNKQFTYDEVEQTVAALLKGDAPPAAKTAK